MNNTETIPETEELLQMELFSSMERSYYKKFLDFHILNPRVYLLFERFAKQLIEKGHKKLGAKMIMERIRWEITTGSKDDQGFKINNNYISYYSRLFVKNNPLLMEYFEFREIRRL